MEPTPQIKTFGEIFPQFMLELVGSGSPLPGLQLLLWNGTETNIQPSIPIEPAAGSQFLARIFEPPDIDPSILKAIHFPTRPEPYESDRALLDEICALVKKYTGLAENQALLAAHSVLASWLVDLIPTPVSLALVGPDSPQGSQLFRLLGCLYRRALVLGEVTLAGISSLPMALCPALFIDGSPSDPKLHKLLQASRGWDSYIPRGGRLINVCGAKVIRTEDRFTTDGLGGQFVEISVGPAGSSLAILDRHTEQQIADEFQPKLLMFRLNNYKQTKASDFDVPRFMPPLRDVARSLGASVPREPELQAGIIPLLQEQNERLESERPTDLRTVVVEAMLELCHRTAKQSIYVGDVADAANKILEQRGEPHVMTDKAVGTKMERLGFAASRLDSAGRGIQLMKAVRRRIHNLARDWDILIEENLDTEQCEYCQELVSRTAV